MCHRWAKQHNLPVNADKSCAMTFTGLCRSPGAPALTFGDREIRHVSSVTVLGVELDARLSFATHVHRTVAKSSRMLGFVARTTTGMPPNAFRLLYTALVLPCLEYCSAIWLPHSAALRARLASVQRRAACTYYSHSTPLALRLSYTQATTEGLLRFALWHTLASRVQAATTRLLCRLLAPGHQELVDAPRLNNRTARLQPLLTRTARHASSWLPRAVALWRQLPPELTQTFPPDCHDLGPILKAVQHV
ncbi:hypothetical protein HPB47_006968 [Ixodes persulcatus]|uniref:Uncharacterized protein n=1 Tax=Ixodes persulcatus TaxID=34615 RepID=A0AC60P8P4_IXOPE|nr:hypothetical protein HPB47_006968 [Ixodes persulcatus]